nr:hypothetical protein [Campylobacter sp.]
MEDFHIVRLKIMGKGRFVKDIGVVFETQELKVIKQLNEYTPHKLFVSKE